MNTKQKLAYIAIGGLLVATGMIISPLNAQKDKFGEIECTKLTVVNGEGKASVILCGEMFDALDHLLPNVEAVVIYEGNIQLNDNDSGSVWVEGGKVTVYDKDGESGVSLRITTNGGRVNAFDKAGNVKGMLGIDEHGGFVQTSGRSKGYAIMGINDEGNGAVTTYDKNGYRQ